MTDRKINVLVVEDSEATRLLLVHLLHSDPWLNVIGAVGDGEAALEFIKKSKPDVVLMDIYMPRMDGLEATRRIMETTPVPIVICSAAVDPSELTNTFRSLEAGAVACIEKPVGPEHPDFAAVAHNVLQTVRLMSEVSVVRRWPSARWAGLPAPTERHSQLDDASGAIKLIGIGASTGGPPVLHTVLSGLPKTFGIPVLIVQHIARGFLPGMAEWLSQSTGLRVQIASYGTHPLPGHAYLAPDDFQMSVSAEGRILLTKAAAENGLRPAVSFLFRSLADVCGPNAVGVLLTGMGHDGAAELKLMKDKGAVTIAQDRESSVVHGMPGVAIKLGGATQVLPASKISGAILAVVARRSGTGAISS
ncbi:MAG: chemotaxis-specific protein-glutamate methyltransferase CheB [Casimicrobiaceae bacterium]